MLGAMKGCWRVGVLGALVLLGSSRAVAAATACACTASQVSVTSTCLREGLKELAQSCLINANASVCDSKPQVAYRPLFRPSRQLLLLLLLLVVVLW
jgi:hypothetical protein